MLGTVPSTITLAGPIDDTHNDTDESYLDDSDIEMDMIAAMPPPTEVSTSVAARPVSETGPGQSSGRRGPTEQAVAPPTAPASPEGHVPPGPSRADKLRQLRADRLARQAEWRLRKEQLGLPPSDDELRPTIRPTREQLAELKERTRVRCEQDRLEKERQAKEREALEREATTSVMDSTHLAPVTESLPGPLDSGQPPVHGTNNLTELEIALAAPDLSPEDRKFLEQRRFQYTTKMVPKEGLTTARQVDFLILWILLRSS